MTLLLLALVAHSAVRVVGPDDPYPTLADAAAVSVDGDVIQLRPGLHVGGAVITRDLTITGLGGASGTVLRGGGTVLTIAEGAVVAIEDLSLDGAAAGRVVDVRPGAVLSASQVVVAHGQAVDGAGIRIDGGTLRLGDSVVVDNRADGSGGGAVVLGGGTLDATDTRWVANSARLGGAVAIASGQATLAGVVLDTNEALDDGGAIWSGDSVELVASSLCANSARGVGGALAVAGGRAVVNAVAFLDNEGGAVHAEATTVLAHVSVLGTTGDAVVGDVTVDNAVVAYTEGTGLVGGSSSHVLLFDNRVDADRDLDRTHVLGVDPLFRAYTADGLCADVLLPDVGSPLVNAGSGLDRDGSVADLGATGGLVADALHWVDLDRDGAPALMDCDDVDAGRGPALADVAGDGVDQDCDARELCWVDADRDGWGGASRRPVAGLACALYPDRADVGDDCDDADAGRSPGRVEECGGGDDDCDRLVDDADDSLDPDSRFYWFADTDGDGYGDRDVEARRCAAPPGYVGNSGDCDDTRADVSPAMPEVRADGVDQDCDGYEVCFLDGDGDGWGGGPLVETAVWTCDEPFVTDRAEDCDDGDPARSPGAVEVCGGGDDDCDGLVDDDDDSLDAPIWYRDRDGDGDGDPDEARPWCSPPTGWAASATDCDERDPSVEGLDVDGDGVTTCDGDCDDLRPESYPGAPEQCSGFDDDCDGVIDDGFTVSMWWADADGDGFGDASAAVPACVAPPGHVANPEDCDDGAASVFPGADAVAADGVDQDCDGVEECWVDADGDGVGGDAVAPGSFGCSAPGESSVTGDCDDADPGRAPGLPEVDGDGVDQDCDGVDPDLAQVPVTDGDTGAAPDVPKGWFCASDAGPTPTLPMLWARRR